MFTKFVDRKVMMKLKEYPNDYVTWKSGCKVGWITYKSKKLANQASKIARFNAQYLWNQGFDFGYASPGQIVKTEKGWMVTIP